MKQLKITDVRIVPGDSGFLIDDGCTAILYDSGFGFTGQQMADRIQKELGSRPLNYIFLTHSHYDHALGSAQIAKSYPGVRIIAGAYAKTIFEKDSAKSVMGELDRKAARQWGYQGREDHTKDLRVDIALQDGDTLDCETMQFKAIALPGHTRCSKGYYLKEQELLLGTETLGVYIDKNIYLPSYLVGYQMTIGSIRKAMQLQPKRILVPHYGVLEQEKAQQYLIASGKVTEDTAQQILSYLEQGQSRDQILELLTRQFYLPEVAPVYPIDAFRLNTSIMIRLIEKELYSAK